MHATRSDLALPVAATPDLQRRSIGAFTLESGVTLPEVVVAYVSHGALAPDGGNAILVTHGYTSGPSMLSPGHHVAESSWAPLLEPGRPLDTSRHCVICSNMLGSSYGTTGPGSLNPATGHPWGIDFPDITLGDIVGVQRALLDALGVRHLRAVVGPSYGGWQALQWALQFPGHMDAIGVLMSGLTRPAGLSAQGTLDKLRASSEWHGGRYHDHGGMRQTMFDQRMATLRNYGFDRLLADSLPDPAERQRAIEAPCHAWADAFDPYSLVVLARAAERFDVRARIGEIRARLLFIVGSTDAVFPPDPATRALLEACPAPLRYRVLASPYGHMASGVEWRRLQPDLSWMLGEAETHGDSDRT
jgi:homoserine O-acetyltransferase/O-succinyltransferase